MPETFSNMLQDLANFVVQIGWIVAICFVLVWVVGRLRARMVRVVKSRGGDENLAVIVDNIVRIVLYLIVGLLVIGGLTGDASSTVTAIGLITAAVSLSLQDVLRNFVSGLYLLIEKPFMLGDTIRVADQSGTVERVDIRSTVIRNNRKEEVFVPNFMVFSQVVRRRTEYEPHKYTVTSPYPVSESFDAIWNAALSVQTSQTDRPSVQITGATADTVDFEVLLWDPAATVRSDAFIAAVKSSLEKATVKYIPE
jgi:small conductance mechanosensitive channel